jgi:hypothetical protein
MSTTDIAEPALISEERLRERKSCFVDTAAPNDYTGQGIRAGQSSEMQIAYSPTSPHTSAHNVHYCQCIGSCSRSQLDGTPCATLRMSSPVLLTTPDTLMYGPSTVLRRP